MFDSINTNPRAISSKLFVAILVSALIGTIIKAEYEVDERIDAKHPKKSKKNNSNS